MISVIIPVFNVEDYLHVCLNSVLKQTYQDFEIICIDDASTDSSLEILEYFFQKDSRIKILKNDTNRGPGFSRNRGLEVASGKYISFLDGDDWFSPDAFEILIEKAEKDNLDLLLFKNTVYYHDSHEFERNYDMEFMNKFENKIFNHYDLDKTKLFIMSNALNKFYLKSFLDENKIRFPNENLIHEDNPFFYKVITSAKRISLINNYIHNRHRRLNSTTTLNSERLFDNIYICYLILEVFLGDYQLYQYYNKEVLTYIFVGILDGKYNQIEDQFKEDFFIRVQEVYKNFIVNYGLYEDILNHVDKSILDRFKFEEIVESINHNPEISVIIPVYNVEKYLNECLDSVVNQTFSDIEIICVNDGSTDESLSVLKEYWSHDSRLKIISQENSGLSAARNAGLKVAKGNYIYFLDSDDYIELDALQKLYTQVTEKDLDMLLFKTCCFDDDSKEKFKDKYFEMNFLNDLTNGDVFNYKDIGQRVYDLAVTMGSTFFKHELISGFVFPEGLIFEDNPFFIEAILNAKKVFFLEKYLYHKRERRDSITVDGSRNFSDIIKIRNIIIDLAKKYDNFYDYLYVKKLNLIKFRFLQTSNEFKEDFFNKIKKDFENHKTEYESSEEFQNIPDKVKSIFYAGLKSKNWEEFEDKINS